MNEPLIDLFAASDVAQVGGKAAALARAHAAGHPVPPGLVVTVAGCAALGDEALALALRDAIARLGPGPFAVRSSACVEDGAERSWAGQLESELGVAASDIHAALVRCAASARALRALAYGARTAPESSAGASAIIVQRMVAASAAGVAFSADPRTGERGVTLIEAVAGLGDALMAGSATPERWRVEADAATRARGPEVLTQAQVAEVAALCRAQEALFGAPQDIEWAFAGEAQHGALWLLQSRPITALPAAPIALSDAPPPGDWKRDDHHAVPTPLGLACIAPYMQAMARLMAEVGMPVKSIELHRHRGQLYRRTVMPGSGKPPPSFVMWLALRLMPSARRGERRARELFSDASLRATLARWQHEHRPALAKEIEALAAPDPEALSDAELLAHIGRCMDLSARCAALHAELGGLHVFGGGRLMLFVVDRLGWPAQRMFELVAGRSSATTALHERVRRLVLEHSAALPEAPRSWAELARTAPGLAAAMQRLLADEGLRMLDYDPRNETLGERPDLLLSILRSVIAAPAPGDGLATRREAALAEAKARLDAAGVAELEHLVGLAADCYASRDDNGTWTVSRPVGLVRRYVLELGRRIEPALGRREHAVYLSPEEHAPALRGQLADVRALVDRRRGEESWAHFHRGPAFLGTRPAPPPLGAFPIGLRRMIRIFDLIDQLELPAGSGVDATGALRGLGLGHRVVVGTARVIRQAGELDTLRAGEVLVCRLTSPEWSLALGRAAAIVTDEGGALSHPAIIAREYGVSAVLGTEEATRRIATGDRVRVDPITGTVVIL